MCRLPFSAVASNPPSDLVLTPLTGKGLPLSAYLVQYHLLFVVVDPFTNESSWILPTAVRVLETSHSPSYYLPWGDVARHVLQPAAGGSFCDWKGPAQ